MASDVPGSGNTKNIGSVKSVNALIKGEGVFSSLGEAYFDDYWMHYLTNDMANTAESRALKKHYTAPGTIWP